MSNTATPQARHYDEDAVRQAIHDLLIAVGEDPDRDGLIDTPKRILVVDVPGSVQLARLLQRDGIDDVLARTMIAAQASRRERLAIADDVLVNGGALDALPSQVEALDRFYRVLAT